MKLRIDIFRDRLLSSRAYFWADWHFSMKRRFYVSTILSSVFSSFMFNGSVSALPIEDAVRTALQTNPDVGIVIEDRRAIDFEKKQSESRYKPSIDLNAGLGHQYSNDSSTRAGRAATNGRPYDTMNRYESGLSLTQMLFDGYSTDAEVARQESRVISASRRVRETSEFVALDAVQAYLEARRQRELAELSEENVVMHEATLELVTRKVSGGAATIADQQQAASRLASSEAGLEDAKARLRDADATFNRIIGENPANLERPVSPFWAMPRSVDVAIDWAISNNATVAVAKADLDTTIREFDTAKSGFFPTVNLELGADANRNVDGTRGADYNLEAMIRMTYNLYRGGEDSYKRKEFLARIAEARQFYNRSVRLTEEEMRLAWNARESSVTRVRAQRREVEANDIVRQTYRQQFDLGGRSLLELLDSENEYFFAKTNLITTEFLAIFSVYRVLATGGVLLSALDVKVPFEGTAKSDPVLPLSIDLGLKDLVDPDTDPILGVAPENLDAPMLDLDNLMDGDDETLDPNELTLDPSELDLDPNELTLDPSELDPNELTLDPNELEFDPNELILDPNELDPDESELDPNELDLYPNELELDPEELTLDPNDLDPAESSNGGGESYSLPEEEDLISEGIILPPSLGYGNIDQLNTDEQQA